MDREELDDGHQSRSSDSEASNNDPFHDFLAEFMTPVVSSVYEKGQEKSQESSTAATPSKPSTGFKTLSDALCFIKQKKSDRQLLVSDNDAAACTNAGSGQQDGDVQDKTKEDQVADSAAIPACQAHCHQDEQDQTDQPPTSQSQTDRK